MRSKIVAVVAAVVLSVPTVASAAPEPGWKWCSSNPEGTWHTGSYMVQNDMWNGGAGPQTICANGPGQVQVTSDQPVGNTEIETYPDVGALYTGTDTPLSDFSTIMNTFSESFPADVTGEAADDVWFDNWGIEMMIWVDTHNEDPSWLPVAGYATIGGQNFTVYDNAPEFIFYDASNETSGTTHILASARWLISNGFMPADSGVTEAEFGWEVAGTNGPEVFNITSYKLTTVCRDGATCRG